MNNNRRVYTLQYNIGRARYVVNYHDGKKHYKDGSSFFDIALFSNVRKRDQFINSLKTQGYVEH